MGAQAAKWLGCYLSYGERNTFVEEVIEKKQKKSTVSAKYKSVNRSKV